MPEENEVLDLRPDVARPDGDGKTKPHEADRLAAQVEFAWRVHVTHVDWISRADSKAWIVVTLCGVALAFTYNLTAPGRRLANLDAWAAVSFGAGIAALISAAAIALVVVHPFGPRRERFSLRRKAPAARRRPRGDDPKERNLIYFGDLRRVDPDDIGPLLLCTSAQDEIRMLARQLGNLAYIAWLKHLLLGWSLRTLMLGFLLLLLSLLRYPG